jgi:hypothetical protein
MRTAIAIAPRPQLPPQLYVDSRTPTKPLEVGRPEGGNSGKAAKGSDPRARIPAIECVVTRRAGCLGAVRVVGLVGAPNLLLYPKE